MHGENPSDIVLVAHGHLLRAFTKRWLGYPMEFPLSLMLDPGAVGVLRYGSSLLFNDQTADMVSLKLPAPQH